MWYVFVALGVTGTEPDVLSLVSKSGLVQTPAFEEDQVSVEELPLVMDEGFAVKVTVGFATMFVLHTADAYPLFAVAFTVAVFVPLVL